MRNAEQGAKKQRVEKLLAELAVPVPVLTFAVAPERQCVDEDGACALELHIVSRRIRQRNAPVQRFDLDVEMQQGR